MFRFIRYIWLDLKNGLLRDKPRLLLPFFTGIFAYFVFDSHIRYYIAEGYLDKQSVSYGDCLLALYGGMKPYQPGEGLAFLLPVVWLTVFLLSAFSVLDYPVRDLYGTGQQALVRMGRRGIWWLSKCCWNILATLYYHGILFLVSLLGCILGGYQITNHLNTDLFLRYFEIDRFDAYPIPAYLGFIYLLLPVMVSIAVNLIQQLLSIWLAPFYAFLCLAGLLLSSAYLMNSWLIGNYAMVIRGIDFYEEGLNGRTGMIASGILILAALALGCCYIKKRDILQKER